MSAPDLKGFLQVGFDVLTSSVNLKTRKILLQVGSVVAKTVDSDQVEQWQHYGIASRMPKPIAGKTAAQVVLLRTGDHDIAIASQDLRGLELYGELDFGEVTIYSAGEDGKGQARVMLKKDGAVSMYTKRGNTDDGAGMLIGIDPVAGACRVVNDKGYGLIVDQDGCTLAAGDAAGLNLNGNTGNVSLIGTGKTQIDGGGIVLGSGPVVMPAIIGAAGLVGVASTKVMVSLA